MIAKFSHVHISKGSFKIQKVDSYAQTSIGGVNRVWIQGELDRKKILTPGN